MQINFYNFFNVFVMNNQLCNQLVKIYKSVGRHIKRSAQSILHAQMVVLVDEASGTYEKSLSLPEASGTCQKSLSRLFFCFET